MAMLPRQAVVVKARVPSHHHHHPGRSDGAFFPPPSLIMYISDSHGQSSH